MTDGPRMPADAPRDVSTRLAVDRTRLAHERTLMAWVRTAVSLISFGFTIYKFFQLELAKVSSPPDRLIGPRGFALIMIGIGLAALFLAAADHRSSLQAMRAEFGPVPRSTAEVVAVLVSVLGFVALIAVILRS
jgi:putative membrane protein